MDFIRGYKLFNSSETTGKHFMKYSFYYLKDNKPIEPHKLCQGLTYRSKHQLDDKKSTSCSRLTASWSEHPLPSLFCLTAAQETLPAHSSCDVDHHIKSARWWQHSLLAIDGRNFTTSGFSTTHCQRMSQDRDRNRFQDQDQDWSRPSLVPIVSPGSDLDCFCFW